MATFLGQDDLAFDLIECDATSESCGDCILAVWEHMFTLWLERKTESSTNLAFRSSALSLLALSLLSFALVAFRGVTVTSRSGDVRRTRSEVARSIDLCFSHWWLSAGYQ